MLFNEIFLYLLIENVDVRIYFLRFLHTDIFNPSTWLHFLFKDELVVSFLSELLINILWQFIKLFVDVRLTMKIFSIDLLILITLLM